MKRNVSKHQRSGPLPAARSRRKTQLLTWPAWPSLGPGGELLLGSSESEWGSRGWGGLAHVPAWQQPALKSSPGGTPRCAAHTPPTLACKVLGSHESKAPQSLPPQQLQHWGHTGDVGDGLRAGSRPAGLPPLSWLSSMEGAHCAAPKPSQAFPSSGVVVGSLGHITCPPAVPGTP